MAVISPLGLLLGFMVVVLFLALNIMGSYYMAKLSTNEGVSDADLGGSVAANVLGWTGMPVLSIVPVIIWSQYHSND